MSDERPWEDYVNPVGVQPPAAPDAPGAAPVADPAAVGYGEDIAKGVAGGLGRGVAGIVGLPGTVGDLVHAGLRKAGVPDQYLDSAASGMRYMPGGNIFTGPDTSDVQKAIENYTGPLYQPKTVPGQYASTIAEFAPSALIPGGGGLAARAFNTVVPAIASETAGQLTKDTAAEPWARGIAGLVAGPVAGKLITPAAPASAARQAAVGVLDREGIPLTAGQRTGSRPVQWMESSAADMPFSAGRAAEMNTQQAGAYDRAVTEHMFDPAQLQARGVPEGVNLPDPRVVTAGRKSLEDEYTRLTGQFDLRSDPQLQSRLYGAQTNYERDVLPSQRTKDVEKIRNDIVDQLVANQGSMPGDVYQATRSRLGSQAKSTTDTQLATALREMRTALDQAMARGLPPDQAAAWALNNQRWANMKQVLPAVASAGENLSPARVAQTTRTGRVGQAAAQSGDLDPLANAAAQVLKPLPNSGTAARTGWQQLFNLAPWLATAGAGGAAGGLPGAAIGVAAPFVLGRAALSRPGQAYLGNQLLPQNMRDIIAQELWQQGSTQPSGIATNQADRAVYEQQRKDDYNKQFGPTKVYINKAPPRN